MHLKLGDDSCAWVSTPPVTARVSAMVTGKPSWSSSDAEPMERRLPGCFPTDVTQITVQTTVAVRRGPAGPGYR